MINPRLTKAIFTLVVLLVSYGILAVANAHNLDSEPETQVTIWDPDPQHIWNRMFQHFYMRFDSDGTAYGPDVLDPLLWHETSYLLEGESYQQALTLLDAFIETNAAEAVDNPLKRAMFQRDMWAIFDWLALHSDHHPEARQALQMRLATIIRDLALSDNEIATLPDNYRQAVDVFPHTFQSDQPTMAYLPPDLFDAESDWVSVGREGGPVAITHISDPYFDGRSAFLIFLRLPEGRQATLDYLEGVRETNPGFPPGLSAGAEVALVRQMLVINDQGEIVATPITLRVSLLHFQPAQTFSQADLSRAALFADEAGGLQAITPDDLEFRIFQSHGIDVFQALPTVPQNWRIETLASCTACHRGQGARPLSITRHQFPLPDHEPAVIVEKTLSHEIAVSIEWKMQRDNWNDLQALWLKL